MKRSSFYFMFFLVLFFASNKAHTQLRVKVESGLIYLDGPLVPVEKDYAPLTDSLDKNLKLNPNDTTSLFLRAILYLTFNDLKAKPYQGTKGVLENLTIAKFMAEKAIDLKMQNFNLKVLRAQLYKELIYRLVADESWKYNSKQIADRRKLFNDYKELANKYYDELAILDKVNAYDYQKLKVTGKYPL